MLFLHPRGLSLTEITRNILTELYGFYDQNMIETAYLPFCWIPRDLALRWFAEHRHPPLVELESGSADVAQLMDGTTTSGAIETRAQPSAKASRETVGNILGRIYDHASAFGKKPPNVQEAYSAVVTLLQRQGEHATQALILQVADEPQFKERRGKLGTRLNGALLPFSLNDWAKSGPES